MSKNGFAVILQRSREATDIYSIRLTASRVAELNSLTKLGKAKGIDVRSTVAQAVDQVIDHIKEQLALPGAHTNGARAIAD